MKNNQASQAVLMMQKWFCQKWSYAKREISLWFNRISFPLELLPKSNYKIINDDLKYHHLIRHSESIDNVDLSTGMIKDKSIADPSSTHMPDCSTSLLGIFKIDHIPIKVSKGKFNQYWNERESVGVPKFPDDFQIEEGRGLWHVLINSIENERIIYTKDDIEHIAICRVVHTPMNWNFWHFSIRWFLPSENCYWHELKPEMRKKPWSSKRLSHETRSLIKKSAKTGLPINTPNLSPMFYILKE